MTSVAFHFGVVDKIEYACRLLRKAVATGARVWVAADDDLASQLDQSLWNFSPVDFLSHCRMPQSDASAKHAQIWIAESVVVPCMEATVLVNLSHAVPAGFTRFDRLIEVIAVVESDRIPARTRWKYYAGQGCEIVKHDVGQT